MKNIIYVQDGKAKNKDLLILDSLEFDIDELEFEKYKENIDFNNFWKIIGSKNPFFKIFIEKKSYSAFLISGILKEKDHLGRNLGFICFYKGSLVNMVKYLDYNLKLYGFHVQGAKSIERKINLLNLFKKSTIIILFILLTIYLYGRI